MQNLSISPNQIILELLKNIKSGRVLDIGSGDGQDSIYLAKLGFNVTSIDLRKDSIHQLNQLAKIHNVKINAIVCDIFSYTPNEKFDIIICNNFLHRFNRKELDSLFKKISSLTKPYGLIVITSFTDDNPPQNFLYVIKKDELKKIYSSWDIISYNEYCTPINFEGIIKPHSFVELIAKKP